MRILYSFGIFLLGIVLNAAALFNKKIKLGVVGRRATFKTLKDKLDMTTPKIWCHCSSLGEYEQGLPVFKRLKTQYPKHQLVLTFFSPSGFEHKKNSSIADVVVYLPLDSSKNAKKFLALVQPELVVFTKYDIWPNYLLELQAYNSKAYLISALFRSSQSYFKFYGGLMRRSLGTFEHIFTQNKDSIELLKSIGIKSASISGDTRFDRVKAQLKTDNTIAFIESFKEHALLIVFGSSWPEDDELFLPYINNYKWENVKFLIAPHKISASYTDSLTTSLSKKQVVSYSKLHSTNSQSLKEANVFILDTIGFLSKAYSYADIAYVGGAAGKTGLHNILEPAVFGMPIIIGKNYNKFPEAIEMIKDAGVNSVNNSKALESLLNDFVTDEEKRKSQGSLNKEFVEKNAGAVDLIITTICKN